MTTPKTHRYQLCTPVASAHKFTIEPNLSQNHEFCYGETLGYKTLYLDGLDAKCYKVAHLNWYCVFFYF